MFWSNKILIIVKNYYFLFENLFILYQKEISGHFINVADLKKFRNIYFLLKKGIKLHFYYIIIIL